MGFLAKMTGAQAATPPTTKQKGDAAEDAALRIVERIVLGNVRNGATYAWPDLDRPLPG